MIARPNPAHRAGPAGRAPGHIMERGRAYPFHCPVRTMKNRSIWNWHAFPSEVAWPLKTIARAFPVACCGVSEH